MEIAGKLKTGKYFDSVSLMLVARELLGMDGVQDAAAVMGTETNHEIVKASGLFLPEFEGATETDLILCIKADTKECAQAMLEHAEEILSRAKSKGDGAAFAPRSLAGALADNDDAGLALISIAGRYATGEAHKALDAGLHVMMFSDNVSVEDEITLKKKAADKGLIVMGPDCGTAIINNIPLAFANVVRKGAIGFVGASGTGLQDVTATTSNLGGGVSQAIGTGGRDIKKDVGGISMMTGLDMLKDDDATKVVVIVAKPPAPEVLEKLAAKIKAMGKPVVAFFLGASPVDVEKTGAVVALTLEDAAHYAVALSKGENVDVAAKHLAERNVALDALATAEAAKLANGQKYLRGLFCGGTFAQEAVNILGARLPGLKTNTPMTADQKIADAWKSVGHTIVDLGEDEFTEGRPHPMIDFSLRNQRIVDEAKDKDVAVLLLDIVIGYGSNMNPIDELKPAIEKAFEIAKADGRTLSVVFSVTGTPEDPQNSEAVAQAIKETGALCAPSSTAAAILAGNLIEKLNK